jgi:methionine salvage enolase-phosphatase E1
MRARRREINIFNMSLLDILCGALGAFCFMMLVLFPYYKPGRGSEQLRADQEKTRELMREIEKLKDQLTEPGAAQNLEELLRKLQAQIQ